MNTAYQITLSETEYKDYLNYLTTSADIIDIKKATKKEYGADNKHPTIKPLKLMEWLIKLTTNENDVVLDIFAGSGTTLQAATNLNRQAIGIELDSEYIKTCKQRSPDAIVLQGDCIQVMKKLDADSVDAIICDPPYAIAMADWDTFKSMKHFQSWCNEWAIEAFRVLRPGGQILAFNAARTYHFMAIGIEDAGFECRDMLEWIYWSGMPKGKKLKNCHEPIYSGIKPDPKNGLKNFTCNIDAVRIPVQEKRNKKDGKLVQVQINNKIIPVVEIND